MVEGDVSMSKLANVLTFSMGGFFWEESCSWGQHFFSKGQNLLNFHELSMAAMSNICFYITSQVKLITDMVVYTPIINKPKYSVPNQASSSDSNLNFFFSGLQPVDPSGGRFSKATG